MEFISSERTLVFFQEEQSEKAVLFRGNAVMGFNWYVFFNRIAIELSNKNTVSIQYI